MTDGFANPIPSDGGRDERLAALLERLVAGGSRAGPDFESIATAHPDLVDELRQLWGTVQVAEHLAELSRDDSPPVSVDRAGGRSPRSGDLPLDRAAAIPGCLGDYDLVEELGRGGMGVVFKARQRSLGRTVALKMVLRGGMASDVEMRRLRAEAEAAARLSHPHIVPVFEVGEHEGQPYFSMKLIEGTTLAKRLADGPLPPREAAELLAPICRAVAEAHRRGVLHRDLKPANILIDEKGHPFVTDFGLAKRVASRDGDEATVLAASLTHSGAILGTPAYMAPEQAVGRRGDVTAAADVYSLGAILYAMLTGRPPFQAASPVDTVLMVLEQDPLPPRLINPKADPDLEMICLKCLQKPVDLRYASAVELADDLEAYLANEPISARSSHLLQVMTRAFRDTHHAPVLENWGLLWMWHSLVVLLLCVVTNGLEFRGVTARTPYVALWVLGLGVWAAIFWRVRRRAGPITFVERQIAHVWAGGVMTSTFLFALEAMLGLPVLQLSPVLALMSAMVFLVKAGILSGAFYVQTTALAITALVMAAMERPGQADFGITLYGLVTAGSFFVPGLRYYRQRLATGRRTAA